MKTLENVATAAAGAVWPLMRRLGRLAPAPAPFVPRWSDRPLPRGEQRTRPPLGFPRQTDSLCPTCVKETRAAILRGEQPWTRLIDGHPGRIPATILERDGRIVLEKTCPEHGPVSDVLSVDPGFQRRIEGLFRGRDVAMTPDARHEHGASTIRWGRGAVLTVDLTNRCNMMCEPCFMSANQSGYVHELGWADVTKILDDAAAVRPRRQLSVQFSGGEPTLSPFFLDAIRYARDKGYFAVQCATNGLRFAEEPGFARRAKDAGLRMAYLQFDGVTNEANAHRKVKNLFDVKQRAIEELAAAGIDVILVVTILKGQNDDQVGPIVRFAVDNADKITVVSFQPVSFSGRDEEVSDEVRSARRYTLSHLVHDVARQTGVTEPMRDWFPLSALAPFGEVVDLMDGPERDFGQLHCGCHPSCGVGTVLFVHKKTKEMVPLCDFVDLEGVLDDMAALADAGRGRLWTRIQIVTSLLRNYRPDRAPRGFDLATLLRQFMSQTGAAHAGEGDAGSFEWRMLFVAGMAFQDVYNYDFRRTEMCIIPYGTQMGEISFCAYNTGVGWRAVVEKLKATATVAEWNETHGRHPVHAKDRPIALPEPGRSPADRGEHEAQRERPPRRQLVHLPVLG